MKTKNKLLTENTAQRLVYLSTLVAGVTSLSLVGFVFLAALGYLSAATVGSEVLLTYLTMVTLCYVYVVGVDVYEGVKGVQSDN